VLRYHKDSAIWTIAQTGSTITTSLDGVDTVEQLPSEAVAHKRFDILVGKQTRDGWKRIQEAAPKPSSRPTPAIVVEEARNHEIEAMILADPRNRSGYQIYADWLEQQGDPRGPLIALMLAVEANRMDEKLTLMTNAYCNRIRSYLTRGIAADCSVTIGRGFIDRIAIVEHELAPRLQQTLAAPSSVFVDTIQLDDDGSGRLHDALTVVATAPRSLRTLVLGGCTTLDDLDPLMPVLPRLERLEIFNILHRELALSPRAWQQLLTSPLTRLESLHLDLSAPTITLASLFARDDLPNLTRLGFRSDADPAILIALAASPLAARLTSLALERFSAAHIDTWNAVRPHFPKLTSFAVPRSEEWPASELYRSDGLRIERVDPERGRRLPIARADDLVDADEYDDVRE